MSNIHPHATLPRHDKETLLGQPTSEGLVVALQHAHGRRDQNHGLRGADLGIGPQGLGGRITALAVNVELIPCHIASFPMAVNLNCHAHRHQEAVI